MVVEKFLNKVSRGNLITYNESVSVLVGELSDLSVLGKAVGDLVGGGVSAQASDVNLGVS